MCPCLEGGRAWTPWTPKWQGHLQHGHEPWTKSENEPPTFGNVQVLLNWSLRRVALFHVILMTVAWSKPLEISPVARAPDVLSLGGPACEQGPFLPAKSSFARLFFVGSFWVQTTRNHSNRLKTYDTMFEGFSISLGTMVRFIWVPKLWLFLAPTICVHMEDQPKIDKCVQALIWPKNQRLMRSLETVPKRWANLTARSRGQTGQNRATKDQTPSNRPWAPEHGDSAWFKPQKFGAFNNSDAGISCDLASCDWFHQQEMSGFWSPGRSWPFLQLIVLWFAWDFTSRQVMIRVTGMIARECKVSRFCLSFSGCSPSQAQDEDTYDQPSFRLNKLLYKLIKLCCDLPFCDLTTGSDGTGIGYFLGYLTHASQMWNSKKLGQFFCANPQWGAQWWIHDWDMPKGFPLMTIPPQLRPCRTPYHGI